LVGKANSGNWQLATGNWQLATGNWQLILYERRALSILDRYVLGSFVRDYLISLMALVGLYVALDMVFNFGNLTQSHSHALAGVSMWRITYDILDYYFYQSFFFFSQMAGMIAVVAASFTLMRLSRSNEMTALLAAGMPLLRVAAPAILAGAVLNLVLLPADQELLIPRLIPKLVREHGDIHEDAVRTFPVCMMEDERGALFNGGLYTPATADSPPRISYLDVVERDGQMYPTAHLYAPEAVWNGRLGRWDLTEGKLVPIASPEENTPAVPERVDYYQSDISPEEIVLHQNEDTLQFLSLARINQLLAQPKNYGATNLLRMRYMRLSQPLVNIILLLLAISMVVTREPQTLKTSAAKAMLICGMCMGCSFLAYELAASPPSGEWRAVWPAMMAWFPIFIFGPLSVYLLDRMKT
jgi:lipopolysaccharide export system permease protein